MVSASAFVLAMTVIAGLGVTLGTGVGGIFVELAVAVAVAIATGTGCVPKILARSASTLMSDAGMRCATVAFNSPAPSTKTTTNPIKKLKQPDGKLTTLLPILRPASKVDGGGLKLLCVIVGCVAIDLTKESDESNVAKV